ncbi:tripartite tricarboxylate transporter TctB family protein [Aeromicrobium sp.]|uniref:tripartite tricarboxylate transporter TctB family protein n=1 Tax=Aeromicrobium sp. TaxID=1871063 RepID=UPI002FC86810
MNWHRVKGEHGDRDTRTHDDVGPTGFDDPEERVAEVEQVRREEWGGMNIGAGFFGWLVAVGMAVLLSGIITAIAAAVGDASDITQSQLERESGEISVGAAIVLLIVLLISFYAGGYVAGRMSRFDGTRQGWAVWLISLLVVVLAAVIGASYGSEYDVMNRVDIPDVPIPTEDLTIGGAVTIAAALFATLLAALAGGKAGTRYHRKVDRSW